MRYFRDGILSIISCLLLLSSPCFAVERLVENTSDVSFQRWIKQAMKRYQVPAVSIVIIKDYKIAWTGYYGVSNILTEQPISDTTLFQAGSLSKPVTAVAILKTIQDGKLRLDADVNDFLVSWTVEDSPFLQDDFITIRELLSHSGGINVAGFIGYDKSTAIPTLNDVLNGRTPANSPEIKVVQAPGTFLYSGGGYTILQQLLVDVYQRSFSDTMSRLVLQPLSMTHSTFQQQLPTELQDQVATPYRPGLNSIKEGPHVYVTEAATGLWTTPFDLAKFIISIQESLRDDPYQILTPENAKMMMEPEAEHMGLGFYVNMDKYGNPVKKGRYFMHTGQNEGYRSVFIASTRDGCGAIIMTNMSTDGRLVMGGKIKDDWSFINNVVQHIADTEGWR